MIKVKDKPKHVKNYLDAFGYDESDVILCEFCHAVGVEIHHVEPRSKFGSKRKEEQDHHSNLICLCRGCHDKAHGVFSRELKIIFKGLISKRNFNR
jgi:5-methylcytosine-specific restriction endonuclease McrA